MLKHLNDLLEKFRDKNCHADWNVIDWPIDRLIDDRLTIANVRDHVN